MAPTVSNTNSAPPKEGMKPPRSAENADMPNGDRESHPARNHGSSPAAPSAIDRVTQIAGITPDAAYCERSANPAPRRSHYGAKVATTAPGTLPRFNGGWPTTLSLTGSPNSPKLEFAQLGSLEAEKYRSATKTDGMGILSDTEILYVATSKSWARIFRELAQDTDRS